jgi:hypothetical protein
MGNAPWITKGSREDNLDHAPVTLAEVEAVRHAMLTGRRCGEVGLPVAAGARTTADYMLRKGIAHRAIPPSVRRAVAGYVGGFNDHCAHRWFRRVFGRTVGLPNMMRAWKAYRPQDWPVQPPKRKRTRKVEQPAHPPQVAP